MITQTAQAATCMTMKMAATGQPKSDQNGPTISGRNETTNATSADALERAQRMGGFAVDDRKHQHGYRNEHNCKERRLTRAAQNLYLTIAFRELCGTWPRAEECHREPLHGDDGR